MFKFQPPVEDMDEFRTVYELYFNSFISVLEYITDDLNQSNYQKLFENVLGSNDNYMYVRDLRNGFIHRGQDLSKSGTVIENLNLLVPAAPKIIYGKMRKNGTQNKYSSFTENLLQLVILCEKCNQIIYDFCKDNNLLVFIPTTNEEYLAELEEFANIPDVVKDFCANFDFSQLDEEQLFNKQIKEYFNTSDILTQNIIAKV